MMFICQSPDTKPDLILTQGNNLDLRGSTQCNWPYLEIHSARHDWVEVSLPCLFEAADQFTDVQTDIVIPGLRCREAEGVDVLNGSRAPLCCARARGGTVLKGMLIKDWPVVIRLAGGSR